MPGSFVVGLEFIAYETIWNPILISFWRIFFPISTNVCANASDQMPAHKLFIGFFCSPFTILQRCCRERKLCCICVFFTQNAGGKREGEWNGKPEATNQKKERIQRFFLSLYLPCGFWRWCGALERIFILLTKQTHSNACEDETTTRRWTCVGKWA